MTNETKGLDKRVARIEVEYLEEYGFIYATGENVCSDENYFQVCAEIKDGVVTVDKDDCGWDWGICGEYNESICADTKDHLDAFLELCVKQGIKVI